ncbi:amidohydrolase family protein [Acidicapsa acidisoli]|uniref:amidohydrolase family protein n=1 Tax=Acidicapsa acidisoli TaxID=1615681 RepID=UPI0021DF8895|nr:amidohydrolase family protein [Acidicapsa acidisoli]
MAGVALTRAAGVIAEAQRTIPIIDSHIHLFDTTRVAGVPWPPKTDEVLYKPASPNRYERITREFGVVGAIAVEASPIESDNDWVLKQAAENPVIVGVVGNLVPGTPDFARELERLHANPLFVGIRYGNLWDRDLYADAKKPGFIADLRLLAAAGLELDSANPDARLIEAILAVSQQVPELRIVIDHLPNAVIPAEPTARRQYWTTLKSLSQNAGVFMKLSEVPVRVGNRLQTDPSFYRDRLDALWDLFGEDRILFGSDWPNSDHVAGYAETLGIVHRYVSEKGAVAMEKYFWKNSITAYRWRRRLPDQPVV